MTTSISVRYVVVLGAAGFIGRHAARLFSQRGFTVLGLGHGDWEKEEWESWGLSEWLSTDITESSLDLLVASRPIDTIIHCAGSGAVSFSYRNPFVDFNRAVFSTASVLEWIRRWGGGNCRFVFLSSAAVYGDQGHVNLNEDSPTSPVSPYGHHKLLAEMLCKSYSQSFNIAVSVIRLFSVYGEGLQKQLLWDALNKFRNGQSTFWGSGEELRDWIHVQDAVELVFASANTRQDPFVIYNGGSHIASICEVLSFLSRTYGANLDIIFSGKVDAGSPFKLCSNSSLARESLDWKPNITLRYGLTSYVDWYRSLLP
jgi:UDP-glucose 4-epimerase